MWFVKGPHTADPFVLKILQFLTEIASTAWFVSMPFIIRPGVAGADLQTAS